MRILGQYDTHGRYWSYAYPWTVSAWGSQLRDESGHVVAIMDQHCDWVSPSMGTTAARAKLKVAE